MNRLDRAIDSVVSRLSSTCQVCKDEPAHWFAPARRILCAACIVDWKLSYIRGD